MEPLIVDIMKDVVEKTSAAILPYLQTVNSRYVAVRYDYGHPSDIIHNIVTMGTTEANRYKKYPLIGLFVDFQQTVNPSLNVFASCRLNFFIASGTDKNYTPEQRTEHSFKRIIYPIRDELFRQMRRHKNIMPPPGGRFTPQQVDRYQWGKGGLEYYNNGQKNIFSDFIDASEFMNMEVSFTENGKNSIC